MPDEDDELIARVYSEHWKGLNSKNPKERDEVVA